MARSGLKGLFSVTAARYVPMIVLVDSFILVCY